jgi:hypothetical protein
VSEKGLYEATTSAPTKWRAECLSLSCFALEYSQLTSRDKIFEGFIGRVTNAAVAIEVN